MSRVSNNPVYVPSNININITSSEIQIKGPLGCLRLFLNKETLLDFDDNLIRIKKSNNSKSANAIAGTTRALIANMIHGVSVGFETKLLLIGVGYRAQADKTKINLSLGYSHSIEYVFPDDVYIETPTQTEIIIKGIDKQKVGQVAADIRNYRKPEPYKGKGIRYSDEVVVLKETKKK